VGNSLLAEEVLVSLWNYVSASSVIKTPCHFVISLSSGCGNRVSRVIVICWQLRYVVRIVTIVMYLSYGIETLSVGRK
jgi:hypothetical protein